MSTLEAAFGQLPEPILNKLDSMIRRIRRLLFLRGLFATLAVGLACLLAIMAIDATITLFSSTARWVLSLTGLAITMVAAWWFLFRPLSRRFTLTHMARILEIRHPELQERISTAVELLSSNDPDSIRGSEELIEAVVDSAVEDVELVDPKTEFKPAKSNKFLLAAMVLASIVALTLVIWPKQSWTLITRALAPYLDIGNAYADSLIIKPGDIRIAKGDSVSIEMSIQHKRLRRAEIRRLLADGTESVERMTLIGEEQDGTKRFSLTFPNVEESFDYRVRAGAALSQYFKVETVLPPSVESLAVRYDYPDYTGLATSESSTQTGEIRAVNHTAVSVTATVNKPVQTSKMIINSATELPAPDVEGNQLTWYFEMKSGMNGSWHLELADVDGFSNAPVSYPLEVLPDKAPTVQLTQPTLRELSLKPTESLQIAADVIEDYGFGDAALVITSDGATDSIEQMQAPPVPSQGPGAYHAKAVLNLPALHLRPDQKRLAVQLRVRDNRPGDYDGPGVGFSETIFINVSKSAKSLADQAIEKQRKEVRENLEEAKRELQRARDEMRRAEQELSRSEDVSPQARERLDEFSERTENARNKLDEVAAALNQSLFQEQSDKAKELANETIAEAREKADLVPVTDGKKERIKEANQARQKVEEAMREIDKLARSMQDAEEDYQTISKLNELANRQQELAMKAEEMADSRQQQAQKQAQSQQQQKQMDQFQAEQNQLQQQLGQMLKDNAAALNEILEGQQEEAQQMSEEAAALAQEQNELKKLSEEALKADGAKQEALKKELLDRLKEEQTQLAQEATQKANQEAAAEATASESPEGESSESDPGNRQEMAKNTPAEQSAGEKGDSATEPQESPDAPKDPASTEPAGQKEAASETPASRSPAEQLAEAAEQATRAAEQLGKEDLEAASEAASEASETLAEAAAQSPGEAMPQEKAAEAGENETGPDGAAGQAGKEGEKMASNEASGNETAPAGEPATPESAQAESDREGSAPAQAPASSAELAERQEALAEQIEAVKNGDLQQALSLMEEQLSAEADSLQAEAQAFEEALKNLSQRSAQAGADRAEQALDRGSQKAGDASKQLADAQKQQSQAEEQGRVEQGELSSDAQSTMQRSQNEQGQSENFLNQAAQALGQTSESIGKTMEGLEPSDMDDRIADSKDLANGFEEMADSAQAQNAQQAAQESQEAANAMKQIAQAAMSKLGNPGNTPPGDPSQQNQQMPQDLTGDPTSENLNETGQKTADGNGSGVPPELERLGISVEDWARFRGALVGGNATAIETELPAEYRELVGRYFQVIAKEAGKDK
jgi:hypothetical protein